MMNWLWCVDGRLAQPFDLLHVALYPLANDQADSPLGYCHYPKLYELPTIWKLLPEETDLFLPKDLVDTLTALLVVSIPVILIIILIRYTWNYFDSNFRSISPSHKKWYVVANLSKAFFLGCIALNTKYVRELSRMFSDDFGSTLTKRSMALYVVTDVVALILVPKLPQSTIIHHIVTFFLGVVTWSTNLRIKGYKGILALAKMGLVYGMISCISFMVNAYLALRVVYPKSKLVKLLCHLSLISYIVCCAVNWSYQIYWLTGVFRDGELSLYVVFYSILVIFIVNDDIILIKWLFRQSSPMASDKRD